MGNERRSQERINSRLAVKWEGMAVMQEARLDDISLGGCFVNTMGIVDAGEIISIEVELPSGEWLALRGEVTSYQPGIGFGMRFTSVTQDEEELLRGLMS